MHEMSAAAQSPHSVGALLQTSVSSVTQPIRLLILVGVALTAGTLVLAAVAWRRRETPGARTFLWVAVTHTGWVSSTVAGWLAPSAEVATVLFALRNTFSVLAAMTWVWFALTYTGTDRWKRGWRGRFLGLVAVVLTILGGGNRFHHLLRRDYRVVETNGVLMVQSDTTALHGVVFLVIIGLMFWSYWIIFQYSRSVRAGQRRQATTIVLADLLYVVFILADVTGVYRPHPVLNSLPVLFSVSLIIIAIAVVRYDFLYVTPLATDALFEEMRDPVVVLDDDRQITDVNDAASELFEEDAPLDAGAPELAEALDGDPDTVTLDTDEGERTFDLSVTVLTDHHDTERGRLIVLRDITVRREREATLNRQNERLDEFASLLSHDIRNPLAVAMAATEHARDTLDDETHERLTTAHERVETLVDDALALARAGSRDLDPEPVSVASTARTSWETVDTGGVRLDVRGDIVIEADRTTLIRIFENLIRNSVEHAFPDDGDDDVSSDSAVAGAAGEIDLPPPTENDPFGGVVDEDATRETTPNCTVTVGTVGEDGFYLADNGVGLDDPEQVFDRGYTTSTNGTGLGMTIVRRAVESHGWTITATNQADSGARFEIRGVDVVSYDTPADEGNSTPVSTA